ncbi:SPOCS domain-containing protein [Pontibacillus sp. HMF3514]|uniref:DUF7507 domain-containing protein n=1 Tax=Pontibacillus sp. HMF3514 TaxID=2692425 RepID=UPI0013203361|nr:SPOCS domain-containing protein [Pontibacillus sp. HMF3514]QHE54121.1 DUF11 domain-containing protein [Pontibacillus sp. HMF3514]
MAIENFQAGTLIIPMDTTYQNSGMYKAYGLAHNLLWNGIPVKWAIAQGKAFNGVDFTASAQDIATNAIINNHGYSGGPFIIDSANAAAALPFITAWQALYPTVAVHNATSPFNADIVATMNRPSRIAVEEDNYGIVENYLNLASITNTFNNPWDGSANNEPDAHDATEIGQGALFGFVTPSQDPCRKRAYDLFISPHTGNSTWTNQTNSDELKNFLQVGGNLHAMCESIESIEDFPLLNPNYLLTQTGIPNDQNDGDTNTFTVNFPNFPITQAVSTGLSQGLPGGSISTWRNSLASYYPQTKVLANFIEQPLGNNIQYDFTIGGPYKGGTGAGYVVYEGGHDYSPKVPYLGTEDENLYYRFVLNSVFYSVAKPFLDLEITPTTIFQNVNNTITFDIVNTGGSPATNTTFSVTLDAGVSYNNDASIPPTSIVGQTLTWNLGTVDPGTAVTFTADYQPAVITTADSLATFSTSYGDNFSQTFSLDYCVAAEVQQFEQATLDPVKSVDKDFATVGDTLTYTTTITNTDATITATNVVFTDIPPPGTTFVPGSLTINAVPQPAADPSVGVALPDIPPLGVVTVAFDVTVDDTLPEPNPIVNDSRVDWSFTNNAGTFDSFAISNQVQTQINLGDLSLEKSADKVFATIGDTITYTTVLTNTGNVAVDNVVFQDSQPAGTSFIPGTFKLDGIVQPAASPIAGVNIGSIGPGAFVTVSFEVSVNSIPEPPELVNTSNATFTYKVDPQGADIPDASVSNAVITQLREATIEITKTADKNFVEVGDTLTYTVVVTNTGDVDLTNVVITDTPPADTTFIPGSVTVNANPQPGANPIAGVNVGTIAPGGIVTMTYSVTVDSLPMSGEISNTASVDFEFQIDPDGPIDSGSQESEPVITQVEIGEIEVVKSVDKAFVEVGDSVNYTIVVTNTGTVTAENVVITDTPPPDTSFVPNSVEVDGVPQPGVDPTIGINLGDIAPGNFKTVSFVVTVDSLPASRIITNSALAAFDVRIDPDGPPDSRQTPSNPVESQVELADISVVKSSNSDFVEVGDTLTYTTTITNTGTVTVDNVIFNDSPPVGTTFIPGSFRLNGVLQPGADPNAGVNIGSIAPGGVKTVSFRVTVDVLPPGGQITNISSIDYEFKIDPNGPTDTRTEPSNPVTTNVEQVQILILKDVDKSVATLGETLNYTINVANAGTVTATNIVVIDAIPDGTSFVENSVKVNGVVQPGLNPEFGIPIGDLPPGGFATVEFSVVVEELLEPPEVVNTAAVTYTVQVDPDEPAEERTEESEPVVTAVEVVELTAIKTADKSAVQVGDTLTYTVEITNTGTLPVENVLFKDQIPDGTTLVPNSVTIDGVPQPGANLSIGVVIGTIQPGITVVITFEVTIEESPCPPELINQAVITFDYLLESSGPLLSGSTTSNEVLTDVGLTIFKQISVDENLTIPPQKPDAEDLLDVSVDVEITSTIIIKTPIGTSFEGQRLTGWKLIVEGKLKQIITYIADVPQQTVHSAHFDVPFSTFLVLPENYQPCQEVHVAGFVEDVYSLLLDPRTIFKNVTLRIEGIEDCK